jgi:hypothetical protein
MLQRSEKAVRHHGTYRVTRLRATMTGQTTAQESLTVTAIALPFFAPRGDPA